MAWPRKVPGVGIALTDPQRFALAHRILAAEGWQENLSGHITWDRGDGTYFCTPWGRWWEEVRASDVMTIDGAGDVVDGPWDVTPAVHLHTEIHRARPDAAVIVHGHPFAATTLACIGQPLVISHQNSCIFDGELVTVDEYDGTVEDAGSGASLTARDRRRDRHPTGPSRRHRDRADPRSGLLQVRHLRTHGALHPRGAADRARPRRRCRSPPPNAPRCKHELRTNAPTAYWDGAARAAAAHRIPTCWTERRRHGHVARRSPSVRGVRRRPGPARRGHVPPRARAARAVGHDHLGRRPRRGAARRVRRSVPREVPRRRAACRRHRRRRRGVALERRAAPERRVQRGRGSTDRASTGSSRRASTRCGAARGTSTPRSPTWTSTACGGRCASRSFLPGFVGQRLTTWPNDPDLAFAAMRAYNDWHLDAWCGAAPDRFIPNQITWLRDPEIAAAEIRRNAARGFKALTFSEAPEKLGLPVAPHRLLGSDVRRVRGDRDRRVPARRFVGDFADDRTRRAAGNRGGAVLRVRHVRGGRLALLEGAGAVPEPQDRTVGRRHRLGRRADRPARPLLQVPARLPPHLARRRPHARARCCGATSGSARSTTPRAS